MLKKDALLFHLSLVSGGFLFADEGTFEQQRMYKFFIQLLISMNKITLLRYANLDDGHSVLHSDDVHGVCSAIDSTFHMQLTTVKLNFLSWKSVKLEEKSQMMAGNKLVQSNVRAWPSEWADETLLQTPNASSSSLSWICCLQAFPSTAESRRMLWANESRQCLARHAGDEDFAEIAKLPLNKNLKTIWRLCTTSVLHIPRSNFLTWASVINSGTCIIL